MKTLKLSARDLVARWYGDRPLGQVAVHDAVTEMLRRGWLTAFIPKRFEWDRTMVFVPQRNDFAAIVRYLDITGVGVVQRGLIESRTRQLLPNIGTGLFLSSLGIAITRIDGNNVFIRGTTPDLALIAHQTRIHPLEQMSTEFLISTATAQRIPRHLWNEKLRLRVALAFDELNLDVPGVLDGDEESDVQSRWLFPSAPSSPPPSRQTPQDCSPPFPPEPFDPDIPPF